MSDWTTNSLVCICGPEGCDDDGQCNDAPLTCAHCAAIDVYQPCPAEAEDEMCERVGDATDEPRCEVDGDEVGPL